MPHYATLHYSETLLRQAVRAFWLRLTGVGFLAALLVLAGAVVALLLQGLGIYVIKNPSEDPLYFNNRVVIADELGLGNAYQREEIEAYKDSMFVKKFS